METIKEAMHDQKVSIREYADILFFHLLLAILPREKKK